MICWKEKISRRNGKIYSINLEKGESQWGIQPNDDEVGWEKNMSFTTGNIYYRNIKTKNTQWDKPKKENQPLEENWKEKRSTKCKQIYYINEKKNISQWNHPNEKDISVKPIVNPIVKPIVNPIVKPIVIPSVKPIVIPSVKPSVKPKLWPMDKVHFMLDHIRPGEKGYAVVLTTGAMNPVHLGHISLIDHAVNKLTREGYGVIGAWLSPSHDLYLQPKAKKFNTIGLSSAFRVEATRLTVADDPFIDVALWESSLNLEGPDWSASDYPEVCLALKKEIKKEFKTEYDNYGITVFYACGSDHAQNNGLYKKQEWGGVVVVPRQGEKTQPENPANKVYVTQIDKEKGSFSSTLIRKAIAENNLDILKTMMSVHAIDFLFNPTHEEKLRFSNDFDNLEKLKDPNFWTKKYKPKHNDFKIPWIKTTGKFNLKSYSKQERDGNYVFNPDSLKLITGIQGAGAYNQTSTVMYTKCMVQATDFKEMSESQSIKPKITPIIGSIQTEIQKAGKRHKIFVLPSQLNAAEYIDDNTIIKDVDDYKTDRTGGPMGQISADPGVAQFILDNACNEETGNDNGINNVRLMGKIKGITLRNGYLKVQDNVDVDSFKKAITNMTIFGVKDVPVRGLDISMTKFVNMDHKVDLIYASAVPFGNLKTGNPTYGNSTHNNVRIIAKLTLFAQYVGSMRLAISRGNCDLFLMPLGGGVFKNTFADINSAIISAYNFMEKELVNSKVNVFLLLYEGEKGKDERDFFTK